MRRRGVQVRRGWVLRLLLGRWPVRSARGRFPGRRCFCICPRAERTGHRKLVRTGQELLETGLAVTMADVPQATVFRYRKHAG